MLLQFLEYETAQAFGTRAILGPGLFPGLCASRAFWGFFGPGPISGPPFFFQSQDPHNFIVEPDPSKESRTISQAGLAIKQSSGQAGLAARHIL